jgi:hypothetical protein
MNKNQTLGAGIQFGDEGKDMPKYRNQNSGGQRPSGPSTTDQLLIRLYEKMNEIANHLKNPKPVVLPYNFFAPDGADILDLRTLANVSASSTEEIFRFVCPSNTNVRMIKYGVFNDTLDAVNVDFIPQINGKRILQYHGDPTNNFKINLSVGVDLSDNALIPCSLFLRPGDILTWKARNGSGVDAPLGVRMVGYVDMITKRGEQNFGG